MKTRIERDNLGEKEVPYEAYYGIHSLRSQENFDITKRPISRQMIKGLALVKKSCAYANYDAGFLTKEMRDAISLTCDEIFNGRLHGQFITDLVQGGAGTSMNMNANEVIANRANEMLGKAKGEYAPIHPIDQVNFCQSANDVIPTAGKIASIILTRKLLVEMKKLANCYNDLADKYDNVVTISQTHLQDCIPVTYGTIFKAIEYSIEKDIKRITQAMNGLLEVNLGGTFIGTGLNADPKYSRRVIKYLQEFSGEDFYQSKNMVECTRNLDSFAHLSSAIKTFALNLQKNVNDLKLLSCCYKKARLPEIQPGSPINPGKINPVVLEMCSQVVFYIEGNDLTITRATQAGEMEFNVYIPIVLACLFENLNFVRRAIRTLRSKCLEGLEVYGVNDMSVFEDYFLTLLEPKLGYDVCALINHQAIKESKSITDVLLEKGYMTKDEIEKFRKMNPHLTEGMVEIKTK